MIRYFLLSLVALIGMSSCITFNTGAKLDNLGKAVPTLDISHDGRYYKLNGVAYKEIMVEYRQLNPKWVGVCMPHNIDTCNDDTPPAESLGAPKAELYLVRLDIHRNDAPAFIKAVDFDYAAAKRVEKKDLPVSYVDNDYYFKNADFETLTKTMYEDGPMVLKDLPTVRTVGNQIRRPVAILLSYGVDLPLTAVSYAVSPILYYILLPFDERL